MNQANRREKGTEKEREKQKEIESETANEIYMTEKDKIMTRKKKVEEVLNENKSKEKRTDIKRKEKTKVLGK